MKIYTRTGDSGDTGLMGGRRVRKSHPRVEAYGTVDELNSQLGVVAALLDDAQLVALITHLQQELLVLGADLSTPPQPAPARPIPRVSQAHVQRLEAAIDRLQEELPPLRTFILPGGDLAAAHLHLARTIARRAERQTVAAIDSGEEISPWVLQYLNRLSDLLFVMARAVNHRRGRAERPWVPERDREFREPPV